MTRSFYWHDYETWGANPQRDRACQFAGLRTDESLIPIGDPLVIYCRPASDLLPQPDACLITGITPALAERKGLAEAVFAARIYDELARPGTCGVGFNSMRFDDEVSRNLFYRNFLDPYAREWQNGNSRWDLIDALRLAHALRPAGIQWAKREDGVTSFQLEHLTAANGIEHGRAHDALADVNATIALARLLKQAQPRLYEYALTLRTKHKVETLIGKGAPLLHVSARYPAQQGCIAPVLPVARHPTNKNGVIVFDLRQDPRILADLSVEEIRQRLFTATANLPDGVDRIPLKGIGTNRSPMLAPMGTLNTAAAERWAIDPRVVEQHAVALRAIPGLAKKIQLVHSGRVFEPQTDPDLMIYSGGFFSDRDRRAMQTVRETSAADLDAVAVRFDDARLPEMLFRYRARNWPETLSTVAEQEEWNAFRLRRLTEADGGGSIQLDAYQERIMRLREEIGDDGEKARVLDDLEVWAQHVMDAT